MIVFILLGIALILALAGGMIGLLLAEASLSKHGGEGTILEPGPADLDPFEEFDTPADWPAPPPPPPKHTDPGGKRSRRNKRRH